MKNQQSMRGVLRLLFIQSVLTTLIAGVVTLFSSATAGLSAVLGGCVSILPTACFARKLFQYQGARAAKQIVNSFYKGEALKIGLSILLFALVFKFFKIVPLVFFSTYIVVQMTFWFAPLIFVNK